MDKRDKAFTVVFTSCLLAEEFITASWWWSGRRELLWWLLLPAAVCGALFRIMRRTNRDRR